MTEAQHGTEAIGKAQQCKRDVILTDICMPGTDGIATTQRIREAISTTRIVMLTIPEEDKNLFDAIKAGADGYLLINLSPVKSIETLPDAVHGQAAISGVTAAKILRAFADQARKGLKDPKTRSSTPDKKKSSSF